MKVLFFFFVLFASFVLSQNTDPCNAFSIPIEANGNITVFGSTIGTPIFDSSNCNKGKSGSVWFSVTPTSGATVFASTCGGSTNFDTYVGVYSGTCDGLVCIDGNDDSDCPYFYSHYVDDDEYYGYDPFDYDPSTVTWQADGSEYFIVVTGNDDGDEGTFDLTIVSTTEKQGCANTKDIAGPYSSPVYINGTISDDDVVASNICFFYYASKGSWFTIHPEPNKYLNISTCSSDTDFDTRLAVVAGSSCSDLTCIVENDDSDYCHEAFTYETSFIRFLPTASEYFVIVGAFFDDDDEYYYERRNYGLSIVQDQNTANTGCIDALTVHVGTVGNIFGSNAGADNVNTICGSEQGPGVWYKVVTDYIPHYNGVSVTFDTCNSQTNFDTVLSVYSGSCGSLTCLASNDDACLGTSSQVTVTMESYETVYLVITGNSATGNYEITITETPNTSY